jgi:hypothetical protein
MRLARGERKARWFIREWTAIGGTFAFVKDGKKTVLGLGMANISEEHRKDRNDLALFGVGFPRVYGTVARIVRAEGLAEAEGSTDGK